MTADELDEATKRMAAAFGFAIEVEVLPVGTRPDAFIAFATSTTPNHGPDIIIRRAHGQEIPRR